MSNFKFRFGKLKSTDIRQSANGQEYAKFAIDAGKFTAYCVTFDAGLIKILAETQEGEDIRAGGFIDAKTVTTDDGEKTYITLITRSLKIGEAETVNAKKADAAATSDPEEIVPDDLTAIKGIGPKAAAMLNELGFFTYAQLASVDAAMQTTLDEDVPAVKGSFSRNSVFKQAVALAA